MAVNLMTLMGVGSSAGAAPPPSFTGVGDITAFDAYYSVARAYSAAYATGTGKLANLRDSVTLATCDILAGTDGLPGVTANCSTPADNGKSITAWTSNPISVLTLYNQVSNGTGDLGSSLHPILVQVGGNWLMQFAGAGAYFAGTFVGSTSQPTSSLAVYENTAGTQADIYTTAFGGGIFLVGSDFGGANLAFCFGSSLVQATASDNALHAVATVANGASSSVKVDGSAAVTGDIGGTANTSQINIASEASSNILVGYVGEAGHAAATAWSSGTQTSLHTNVSAFYGTP